MVLDRMVIDRAEQQAPWLVLGVPARCRTRMLAGLVAQVLVGADAGEFEIVWRI
jgi:hypothetical protein